MCESVSGQTGPAGWTPQPVNASLERFFINFYKLFGHIGSLLLCRLSLVVVSGDCGAQAPHGSGFSFCRVSALGTWASVVVVHS